MIRTNQPNIIVNKICYKQLYLKEKKDLAKTRNEIHESKLKLFDLQSYIEENELNIQKRLFKTKLLFSNMFCFRKCSKTKNDKEGINIFVYEY